MYKSTCKQWCVCINFGATSKQGVSKCLVADLKREKHKVIKNNRKISDLEEEMVSMVLLLTEEFLF